MTRSKAWYATEDCAPTKMIDGIAIEGDVLSVEDAGLSGYEVLGVDDTFDTHHSNGNAWWVIIGFNMEGDRLIAETDLCDEEE